MEFKIKYGKTYMEFQLDEKNYLGEILPNNIISKLTGIDEVKRALENPLGAKRLRDVVKKGEKIVIVTSDITRPMPSRIVLPPVLAELEQAGVETGDIVIVFALGSHRKHTEEEQKYLVGEEIWQKIRCIDSETNDCIRLGVCQNGTPVDIFSEVAKADRRICLGNTEYHYFAGYSGGLKAIMPGVSSREAIEANHRNMVTSRAVAGNLDDNPVRNDIDEVANFLSIDYLVNVILDDDKKVIKAFAGHCIEAHRASCRFLDSMYKISVRQKADIVITSPGGFPKDINLYQAQKAMDNAKHIVKDGGIIIFVAACKEGYGEKVFEEWIMKYDTPQERVEKIREHFQLGGHKAAAMALVQQKADIFLVSDLEDAKVIKVNMLPYKSVQEAIDKALKKCGPDAEVYLMPSGGSTLPVIEQ